MKKSITKYLLVLLAVFLLMFVLRLGYGYKMFPNGKPIKQSQSVASYSNTDFSLTRSNYATKKYKGGGGGALPGPSAQAYDQKYEKIGTIGSKTDQFDQNVAAIKKQIEQYNGLIQYEQQAGLIGQRYLHLAIGVPPDNFDEAIESMKAIGTLLNIRIDKTDKTNEFQKLNARRSTLQDHLDALLKLKSQTGKIEEYMSLEERIQQINKDLQDLGVSLGEFDSNNEFCTIKYTLSEVKVDVYNISTASRMMTAFTWTVKYFFVLMLAFIAGAGAIGLVAYAWNKFTGRSDSND